ncbi:unnamed protein product [Ostreobium quekettii]|uniref:Uncharacterized protein n=1 Tax=Ostreobium quekettii TaxID=121088 RepID=A0A8S1J0W4_9CHLO|nr:unnamed protein product [Ostreobium quekettii]
MRNHFLQTKYDIRSEITSSSQNLNKWEKWAYALTHACCLPLLSRQLQQLQVQASAGTVGSAGLENHGMILLEIDKAQGLASAVCRRQFWSNGGRLRIVAYGLPACCGMMDRDVLDIPQVVECPGWHGCRVCSLNF